MSKLTFFDFVCSECAHKFEEMVQPDIQQAPCPQCGQNAVRQISTPRIDRSAIALTAGASPESLAHFDRLHREKRAIEEKRKADHGDYGRSAGAD